MGRERLESIIVDVVFNFWMDCPGGATFMMVCRCVMIAVSCVFVDGVIFVDQMSCLYWFKYSRSDLCLILAK